mmetsp:Transcript_24375/g.79565  ORF Transcript_24375/g.79565 Transcript_24375/m.79565 type:complete len:231 (+) Transcript_24375:326-1018(+)
MSSGVSDSSNRRCICRPTAFRGPITTFMSSSSLSARSAATTGKRPTNSGMRPYLTRSSTCILSRLAADGPEVEAPAAAAAAASSASRFASAASSAAIRAASARSRSSCSRRAAASASRAAASSAALRSRSFRSASAAAAAALSASRSRSLSSERFLSSSPSSPPASEIPNTSAAYSGKLYVPSAGPGGMCSLRYATSSGSNAAASCWSVTYVAPAPATCWKLSRSWSYVS